MPRAKKVPAGMPAVSEIKGSEREQLATWWKNRVRELEDGYLERIERLREGNEHPIPAFAQMVRTWGALGMPKALSARMLQMTAASFATHYGDDYEVGSFEILSSVAANAMRIGTSTTDTNAARVAIQILDRRGGEAWKPPAQQLKVERPDEGAPFIDSSKLPPEDREALRQICERQLLRQESGEDGEEPTE